MSSRRSTRFKLNGDLDLRMLPEAQDFVDELGHKLAARCGEGYVYRPPTRNKVRDRGIIVTDTIRARYDNAKHMTIVKTVIEEAQS